MGNLLNLTNGREIDMLCREHHRSITRVHTSILNVLGDGILDDFALVGNGIELYLLRLCHKLRNHHRELL